MINYLYSDYYLILITITTAVLRSVNSNTHTYSRSFIMLRFFHHNPTYCVDLYELITAMAEKKKIYFNKKKKRKMKIFYNFFQNLPLHLTPTFPVPQM